MFIKKSQSRLKNNNSKLNELWKIEEEEKI